MEMMELFAVEIALTDAPSCPFCAEKDDQGRTNDLGNDSGALGDSLTAHDDPEPKWVVEIEHPGVGFQTFENELRTNAHHLIPADASFNPHPKIKKFVEAAKGEISKNIGYGVNHAKNGVWLPSYPREYQVTRTTAREMSWGEMTANFPDMQHRITVNIMKETQRQFHDAHIGYSNFVKLGLDKICERLVEVAMNHKCNGPAEPMPKPWPPPFALVAWLDNMSNRLKGYLLGSRKNWKDPVFTSDHARVFKQTGR